MWVQKQQSHYGHDRMARESWTTISNQMYLRFLVLSASFLFGTTCQPYVVALNINEEISNSDLVFVLESSLNHWVDSLQSDSIDTLIVKDISAGRIALLNHVDSVQRVSRASNVHKLRYIFDSASIESQTEDIQYIQPVFGGNCELRRASFVQLYGNHELSNNRTLQHPVMRLHSLHTRKWPSDSKFDTNEWRKWTWAVAVAGFNLWFACDPYIIVQCFFDSINFGDWGSLFGSNGNGRRSWTKFYLRKYHSTRESSSMGCNEWGFPYVYCTRSRLR